MDERGYSDTDISWDSIKVGASTRDDVLAALGTPSTQSDFGEESWFYIRNTHESVAFLKPAITAQKVTSITFDSGGTVKQIQNYDQSQSQDVDIVSRVTPTEGHKLGILEQVVGNLGRFNKGAESAPPKKRY